MNDINGSLMYTVRPVGVFLVCLMLMATSIKLEASVTASVKQTKAGPMLFINGKQTAPVMLQIGYQGDLTPGQREVSLGAANGINIVSPTLWGIPWFREGEKPTLDGTDIAAWMEASIRANPKVMLIPRFPVDQPPGWWVEEHPGEMMLFHDGSKGIASVHSRIWRKEASRQIGILISLLEERFGDNIIGYHVCGQYSAEWFYYGFWENLHAGFENCAVDAFRLYLKDKYKTDHRLQEAWADPKVTFDTVGVPGADERTAAGPEVFLNPQKSRKIIDFSMFQNIEMADAVSQMCKAVKDAAPNRLAITFYGYTLELSGTPRSGHIGLTRLLKSPYIDAVCAPYSYGDREPGGSGRFMGLVDTVLNSGKLFITEDDTRTMLSDISAGPGRCADLRQTQGVLARNFLHSMTRGSGIWWMDPVGKGMFADDELMKHNSILAQAYQTTLPQADKYRPEIAVIVDEESCFYNRPFIEGTGGASVNISLMAIFRQELYRIGTPLGMYSMADLTAGKVPPAKLYIMLNLFKLNSKDIAAIKRRVRNKTVLWMYAPGITDGNTVSAARVSDITGINLRTTDKGDGDMLVLRNNEKFSAQHPTLSPMFCVEDDDSVPLAEYAVSHKVAIARKDTPGFRSIYCGTLRMPVNLLRTIAIDAGVHIYNNQDQIVMAGNGYVGLHATSDGLKVLRLPKPGHVSDVISGENAGYASVLRLEMKKGDTKVLKIAD